MRQERFFWGVVASVIALCGAGAIVGGSNGVAVIGFGLLIYCFFWLLVGVMVLE